MLNYGGEENKQIIFKLSGFRFVHLNNIKDNFDQGEEQNKESAFEVQSNYMNENDWEDEQKKTYEDGAF